MRRIFGLICEYLIEVKVIRFLSIALCLSFVSITAQAQEISPIQNQTTPPSTARYEIVQSQRMVKLTFRLDRFTGNVSQLVENQKGDQSWQEMKIIGLPKVKAGNHPHFQIFLSGIAVKSSYLIDVDTGRTWTFTIITDEKGQEIDVMWMPFGS